MLKTEVFKRFFWHFSAENLVVSNFLHTFAVQKQRTNKKK